MGVKVSASFVHDSDPNTYVPDDELAAYLRAVSADEPPPDPYAQDPAGASTDDEAAQVRTVRLTPAAEIKPRPVRWLWEDRIPSAEVTLTPGKGGIGKSTFHAWLLGQVTTGTLPGVHHGIPKPCLIAATEDSWARTIVPRLIAVGADLDRVYRVDVVTVSGAEVSISLPRDVDDLEAEIGRLDAALLSVDPLLGVVSSKLDTHKDHEVRQALEPLGRIADRTGCSVIDNAHFNKSASTDPLTLIMGSAAFANVARAALGFARDADADDGSCVISQVKNNLGRLDLPSLRYRIDSMNIDTDEGPAEIGRLTMLGESDRTVADILRDQGDQTRTERDDAKDFLRAELADGDMPTKQLRAEAVSAGLSWATIRRAADDLGIRKIKKGKPGEKGQQWLWRRPREGAHDDAEDAQRSDGEHRQGSVSTFGIDDAEQLLADQLGAQPIDDQPIEGDPLR